MADDITRKIIHCDADCFFAAIEMRDDPRLRQVPMAVGGSPDRRGVISTCNYLARRFGVRSAMASRTALQLCPDLVIVPHRMAAYREAADVMRNIFRAYTDQVEVVSIDEAYLDVSDNGHFKGSATRIAQAIRAQVAKELSITVSAGVARNKFLAKVASEWRKPDGLFVIEPSQEADFVENLPVSRIPGVGKVTAAKLERQNIGVCRDLSSLGLDALVKQFGVFGRRLHAFSRGVDDRPVRIERVRKSLSVEHTFASDLPDLKACQARLPDLFQTLCERFGKLDGQYNVGSLFIKIKFDNFLTTTHEASANTLRLSRYQSLVDEGFHRARRPVRLLGLGIRFIPGTLSNGMHQLPLFQESDPAMAPSRNGIGG